MSRFANTYCSQCGAELGPGEAGVSSCTDHAGKPLLEVLAAIDDHLQALQHYAYSQDLRKAMTTATDLLEAARAAEAVFARQKWLTDSPDPEAVALFKLRAAIARATGGAA